MPLRGQSSLGLRASLMAGSGLSLFAVAAEAGQAPQSVRPEQVIIEGQRPEDFKVEIPNLSKLTEPLLDTPQSIDVIPTELLRDRAVSNLSDALRNVPGISLGAGEFSFQGDNPTIRGFVARNDLFLDGLRDFGSYSRDPFNLQQIEVLQGPSSVLFGRGSTGGVINQASKMPGLEGFMLGTLTGGTDMTRRATFDVDAALPDLGSGAALRINGMLHAQSVAGRNAAKQSRFGLAPSLALGLGTPTRLTLSYFDQTASDVPDYGVPWFGTAPAPVPRQNFYGFKSDFLHTGTDIGTFKIDHDLTPAVIVRNTVRYAYYTRDFRISEPLVTAPAGTPLPAVNVSFNIWSGDSVETMAWDQLETQSHFETFGIEHALITGIEGGRESSAPEFDNSSGVPTVPLLNPDPDRPFVAAATFPRVIADTVAWSFAAYALDTLKIGEQWEVSGGLRWDYFRTHYRASRFSTLSPGTIIGTDDVERTDRQPSYRGAVVYKPRYNSTIYFDYGTSFNPSAESLSQITSGRGLGIGNSDLAPEKNQTFEVGTKWEFLNNQLSLSAALFRLEKENARVPDPNKSGFNMLAGTQRVDGFDAGLVGRVTENWQVTLGYTYLDGQVAKSAPGAAPVGAKLPNTPEHTFSFFTEYRLGSGFEIGGGGQYVSTRLAQNTPPLKAVPGYWTFDVMAKYDFSERVALQLNVNNLFDKYYFDALHPFHVVPGAGRVALLTLSLKY